MVVFFYRWRLRSGREEEFKQAWRSVTQELAKSGSEGSALFRANDGTWCGIARWPNAEARAAVPNSPALAAFGTSMAATIETTLETLELTEELNLWAAYTPTDGPSADQG